MLQSIYAVYGSVVVSRLFTTRDLF